LHFPNLYTDGGFKISWKIWGGIFRIKQACLNDILLCVGEFFTFYLDDLLLKLEEVQKWHSNKICKVIIGLSTHLVYNVQC